MVAAVVSVVIVSRVVCLVDFFVDDAVIWDVPCVFVVVDKNAFVAVCVVFAVVVAAYVFRG